MSSKWNFSNDYSRGKQAANYKPLDTNVDHYKSKFDKPYHPKSENVEGVQLHLMSGSFFKTKEFTVDDIKAALEDGSRWLLLDNGGAVNLGYVERYEPYIFYPSKKKNNNRKEYEKAAKEDAEFAKRWREAAWS